VNDQRVATLELKSEAKEVYPLDLELPAAVVQAAQGRLTVRFVAQPGSIAGGLYGLRLLKADPARDQASR
jgi:hypothetical protein